jgi:hypothetical protein
LEGYNLNATGEYLQDEEQVYLHTIKCELKKVFFYRKTEFILIEYCGQIEKITSFFSTTREIGVTL